MEGLLAEIYTSRRSNCRSAASTCTQWYKVKGQLVAYSMSRIYYLSEDAGLPRDVTTLLYTQGQPPENITMSQ